MIESPLTIMDSRPPRLIASVRVPWRSLISTLLIACALVSGSIERADAHRIRIATFYVSVGDTQVIVHAPLVPLEVLSDTIAALQAHQQEGVLGDAVQEESRKYFDERIELREGKERRHFAWMQTNLVQPDTAELARLVADGILIADSAGAIFLEIRGGLARAAETEPLTLNAFHLFERLEDAYPPLPVAVITGPGYQEVFPFDGFASWTEPVNGRTLWVLLVAFLGSGVWHIFTGYDHILFLLGLHLSSPNFKETIKIVTAFTISHTITLTLAATGIVTIASWLVEPAIALTIIYVGVENIWKPAQSRRWLTAFFFGLIHGFGFAGALGESLSLGHLDRWAFAIAILSFNLGVEAGQVAVVAALAPLWVGVRFASQRRRIVVVGSILISLAGLAWFIERVFL